MHNAGCAQCRMRTMPDAHQCQGRLMVPRSSLCDIDSRPPHYRLYQEREVGEFAARQFILSGRLMTCREPAGKLISNQGSPMLESQVPKHPHVWMPNEGACHPIGSQQAAPL